MPANNEKSIADVPIIASITPALLLIIFQAQVINFCWLESIKLEPELIQVMQLSVFRQPAFWQVCHVMRSWLSQP